MRLTLLAATIVAAFLALGTSATAAEKVFRAGAFAIDVTPLELPVIVNGGMTERVIDKVEDRLHARCLVLDDGTNQIAIVIVDSCMMPRSLLDEAKQLAHEATKIPVENMLIAATHCHSAPSVFGCLGSDPDEKYVRFLPVQIAKGIQQAHANLQPAQIGWAVGRNDTNVGSRRWLMKPGVASTNPYSGKSNDRVMMHPGPANKNAIAATGIIDPDVPVLSVRTRDGQPLAVLTNYSMHYVGAPNLSADYFAVVCEELTKRIKPAELPKPFVAMHSNGTSGDQWLMDYTKPRRQFDRFSVGADLAASAYEAYQRIFYYDWVPLVMAEKKLELKVRVPSPEELTEAKAFYETFKDRKPKTVPEVYAREAVLLAEGPPTRELKLQALRIGELGIAAIPNEVFSSTGLMIKIESPTPTTFTIELANGCDGYIPPPKQHKLGGYETWRARSSCLEVDAEPKIRAVVLDLLNQVNQQRADEQPVLAEEKAASEATPAKEEAKKEAAKTSAVGSPLSPSESLRHFQLPEGFRIEVVAAEPQIVDPVAFDWGFDGSLWVVEMHDYPNGLGAAGPDDKGPPGGRVKRLVDTDGDGRYDQATTFADGLAFPNSILVLPDSVLVTAAPHILRLQDTNGDGKADRQEVLFSGFAEGNQQLRVNGLKWGSDGWIYCANGGVGRGDPKARVKVERTGELVDLGARDFRFSRDFKTLEPQLGMSQFGRNRDDFGNWFGCNNNTPLFHVVHDDAYLRRNPHVVPAATTVFVPRIARPGPVFAISEKGRFYHASEVGRFTSANSAMIHTGRGLGDDFYGNFFVSEPVHNLVHREQMSPLGATFTSRRAPSEERREFLASDDTWFRPNMIRTGPDGALYISDMYREIVEHPAWIQPEKKAGLTFRNGDDRGRIYRVVYEGAPRIKVSRIDQLPPAEVAALLRADSGQLRELAQQWIVLQQLEAALPVVAEIAADSSLAAQRVDALWTLELLGRLSPAAVASALEAEQPQVRAQAVLLAERVLKREKDLTADGNKLQSLLSRLASDETDAVVQLKLAYVLGELPAEQGASLLAKLLTRTNDAFVVEGALSSLSPGNIALVTRQLTRGDNGAAPEAASRVLPMLVPMAAAFEKWDVVEAIIRDQLAGGDPATRMQQVAATIDACARHGMGVDRLSARLDAKVRQQLVDLMGQARQLAVDSAAEEASRIAAISLLGRDSHRADDVKLLAELLGPQSPASVQSASVEQLTRIGEPTTAKLLLAGWASHSPALRSVVLDTLLSREAWTNELLERLAAGDVRPADLDAVRRQRLLEHPHPKVKERAAQLLAESGISTDRQAVLAAWQKVLAMKGEPTRGKAEFTKRCANCHKWQGEGASVGPDLNTLTDRSPKTLLTAILDPNQAVEPRYQTYSIETVGGQIFSGMLIEETASNITLADAGGMRLVIARSDIAALQATGRSLMPEGLERDLTPETLADLLALLAK